MNPHRTGRMWTYRAASILLLIIGAAIGGWIVDAMKEAPPICYFGGGGL